MALCRRISTNFMRQNMKSSLSFQRSATAKASRMRKAEGITDDLGRLMIMGGCAAGLGAVCTWGVLTPTPESTMQQSIAFPAYVRERIRTTYSYYGLGLATTGATAVALFRRPRSVLPLLERLNTPFGAIGAMAGCFLSGLLVMNTPYTEGLGLKQLMWVGHSALLGVFLSPAIMVYGGAIAARALLYTGGVLGGLTMVAVTAPNDKFLYAGGTLSMGFAALFIGQVGTMFMRPGPAMPVLHNIFLYGGLALFSGFILYYTQGLVHRAKHTPLEREGSPVQYDPINNAIGLYTHSINLFIKILQLVGGSGRKK